MNLSEAAFQFHCMICYEEFENSPERHPVVLPCGHTYICKTCGDRLDKCMECRRDLFIRITPESITSSNNSTAPAAVVTSTTANAATSPNRSAVASPLSRSAWGRTGGRGASSNYPNRAPPAPPIKRRLPLPKNAVLLSLIEATRMISAQEHSSAMKNNDNNSNRADDDTGTPHEDNGEEPRIETDEAINVELAAAVSTGKAGTYAVASRRELQIFPTRPSELDELAASYSDEDVNTLVEFFHDQQRSERTKATNDRKRQPQHVQEGHEEDEMATLAFGDRIQVVSIDRGWAKLARAYGYVRCSNNEIVKVGNPIDRACILEGALRSVSDKRRELSIQQSENDTQFIKLMNHLQGALQADEDLTVICRTVFHETDENDATSGPLPQKYEEFSDSLPTEESSVTEKDGLVPPSTHSIRRERSACADIFRCDSKEVESSCIYPFDGETSMMNQEHPSPDRMRAGALAWRERQSGDSRASINFRTGMSGHKALLSNHSHPHDFLLPEQRGGLDHVAAALPSEHPSTTSFQTPAVRKHGMLKMSTHSGLTMSASRSANKNPRGKT